MAISRWTSLSKSVYGVELPALMCSRFISFNALEKFLERRRVHGRFDDAQPSMTNERNSSAASSPLRDKIGTFDVSGRKYFIYFSHLK